MNIKYLVVHCADTPNGRPFTAEDIHKWHKERGFDGIGYHAVILLDGMVQHGRPYYWAGAHAKGYNHNSLGVCLIGKSEFEKEQLDSLHVLLRKWKILYPDAEIVGHCDLDPVNKSHCPGFNVMTWTKDVGLA